MRHIWQRPFCSTHTGKAEGLARQQDVVGDAHDGARELHRQELREERRREGPLKGGALRLAGLVRHERRARERKHDEQRRAHHPASQCSDASCASKSRPVLGGRGRCHCPLASLSSSSSSSSSSSCKIVTRAVVCGMTCHIYFKIHPLIILIIDSQ